MLKRSSLIALSLSLLYSTHCTASNDDPDCFNHDCTIASGYSSTLKSDTPVEAKAKKIKAKFRPGIFFDLETDILPTSVHSDDQKTVYDNLAIRVTAGEPLLNSKLVSCDGKGQLVSKINSITLAQNLNVTTKEMKSYEAAHTVAENFISKGFTVYLSGTIKTGAKPTREIVSATHFRPACLTPWIDISELSHVHLKLELRGISYDRGCQNPIMDLALIATKVNGQDVPAKERLYKELFQVTPDESSLLTPTYPVVIEMGKGSPKTDTALIVRQIAILSDEMIEALNREQEVRFNYRETGIPMAEVAKLETLTRLTMALSDFTPHNLALLRGMKRLNYVLLNAFPTNVTSEKAPKEKYRVVRDMGEQWLQAHPLVAEESRNFGFVLETNDY